MRIAIDLRRIRNPGIGRYMQCLTEAVLDQNSGHEFLLIMPPDAQETISIAGRDAEKLVCGLKYYSLREQMELPRILRRQRVDLLHSPHFLLPLRSPCATVVTIHDVIYIACKEDLPSWTGRMYYRSMMGASARRAERIITVSEFSKKEIVRTLNIDPAKVGAIHSGISASFQRVSDLAQVQDVQAKYGIKKPFIFYAGIYKPRKNHAGLLRAFQRLIAGGVAAQLVIAGPMNEGGAEVKKLALELGVHEDVVFTGVVDDFELAALYSGARVYACPSLYEGFGFTVLEAMACGTPVVCSAATSLPEIAGDAALYADPRSPQEFALALEKVLVDPQLRTELIEKGYKNCRRFSWKKTAERTIAVYEQAAGRPAQKAVYA